MKFYSKFILLFIAATAFTTTAYPQSGSGAQAGGNPNDTNIVFKSPRPLISDENNPENLQHEWGLDFTFSNNGFGIGAFYHQKLSANLLGIVNFFISGARKTDEVENIYDPNLNITYVQDKIHRIYMMPLMFGIEHFPFSEQINESFRPFWGAGIGPTVIMAFPYNPNDFFKDLTKPTTYIRFGTYVGIGTYITTKSTNMIGLHVRYYYIPFGGNGLESIINQPIQNFGGLVIALSLGIRF